MYLYKMKWIIVAVSIVTFFFKKKFDFKMWSKESISLKTKPFVSVKTLTATLLIICYKFPEFNCCAVHHRDISYWCYSNGRLYCYCLTLKDLIPQWSFTVHEDGCYDEVIVNEYCDCYKMDKKKIKTNRFHELKQDYNNMKWFHMTHRWWCLNVVYL